MPVAEVAPPRGLVFLRYLAFQLPGWAGVGLAAWLADQWTEWPRWITGGALGLFVLKDLVLFPFVRRAYEPSSGRGSAAPIGVVVVSEEEMAPAGVLQIGPERWRARLSAGGVVPAGTRLVVLDVDGLVLLVEPLESDPA